jgi:hypothetical protein
VGGLGGPGGLGGGGLGLGGGEGGLGGGDGGLGLGGGEGEGLGGGDGGLGVAVGPVEEGREAQQGGNQEVNALVLLCVTVTVMHSALHY